METVLNYFSQKEKVMIFSRQTSLDGKEPKAKGLWG